MSARSPTLSTKTAALQGFPAYVDGDDVGVGVHEGSTAHQAADTAEAVDANADSGLRAHLREEWAKMRQIRVGA